jgi:hypothetical protein
VFTSENAHRLSIPEIEELLLTLPEIREELAAIRQQVPQRRRAA